MENDHQKQQKNKFHIPSFKFSFQMEEGAKFFLVYLKRKSMSLRHVGEAANGRRGNYDVLQIKFFNIGEYHRLAVDDGR